MESFTVVFENAEYSAMYRVTYVGGCVRYELLPGTLAHKARTGPVSEARVEIL